jgi:hypothetical protein
MSLDPKTERLAEAVATALGHYLAWIQEQPGLKNTPEVTASLETGGAWMKKFHFCISHPVSGGEGRTMHEFSGTREEKR